MSQGATLEYFGGHGGNGDNGGNGLVFGQPGQEHFTITGGQGTQGGYGECNTFPATGGCGVT